MASNCGKFPTMSSADMSDGISAQVCVFCFQAEAGIRDVAVTGVQTCALPISSAMELMKKGRRDYADVERYCADPKAFLAFLDTLGVERAGLINYVAPRIIGFTPEVNDWSAQYCSAAPDRLIAFGGVLPGTVRDPGAEVEDRKSVV